MWKYQTSFAALLRRLKLHVHLFRGTVYSMFTKLFVFQILWHHPREDIVTKFYVAHNPKLKTVRQELVLCLRHISCASDVVQWHCITNSRPLPRYLPPVSSVGCIDRHMEDPLARNFRHVRNRILVILRNSDIRYNLIMIAIHVAHLQNDLLCLYHH